MQFSEENFLAVAEIGEEQLKKLFIEKASTPQEALDKAIDILKTKGIFTPKILVLPDGCLTVPNLPD